VDDKNLDGCKKMNLDAKKPAESKDKKPTEGSDEEKSEKDSTAVEQMATKIVIVQRGQCSFVTKVRNAERAGASLLVVADHQQEDIQNVIMGDDGTGTGIRIPSMLIGKAQGAILMDQAKLNKEPVTLSAEFVMKHPDNTVEMELWYSSANVLALDFIKEFDKYMKDLQDYLDFTPRFVTWGCTACTKAFKQRECFSEGKYCAPNHGISNAGAI